ncbi:CAP-gly domain-containing protein [Colletotrichum incanum]|nr:CAP-gly domain-containing protein [Colletotrichum incanum]
MSDLAVGQTVRLPDGRTGIVRFVGNTHFASGDWVGVELEDDSGKNDGSVQGERYFDCSMGHGMFVRPTTLVITAPAPAAAAKSARRPSRPSSFNPGTGRTASDTGLTKRMSLNAPSPSPGPKASRPPSILRVITDQVTNKTARISNFEFCAITNYHTFEYPYAGCRGEGTARRWSISHIHGPSSNACIQNYPAALDIFSTDKADPGETHEWSTLYDWADDHLCQKAVCGLGSWEECSGQRR